MSFIQQWAQSAGREALRHYAKNQLIIAKDEVAAAVLIVTSGTAAGGAENGNRKVTTLLFEVGSALNLATLFGVERSPFNVTAFSDQCSVAAIAKERVRNAVLHNEGFSLELLRQIIDQSNELVRRLEQQVFSDIPTKVASEILGLMKSHGKAENGSILIDLKITHQDLARLIGAARENTTPALNKLARAGIIAKKRFRIEVINPEALREVADGEREIG